MEAGSALEACYAQGWQGPKADVVRRLPGDSRSSECLGAIAQLGERRSPLTGVSLPRAFWRV
jgi:hypothetical protein